MKINPKSQWNEKQIIDFLSESKIPLRLSFCDLHGHPRICSLWFKYNDGILWAASHQNAYLVRQLQQNDRVSFEVSTDDYPYRGVRGTAVAGLVSHDAGEVLQLLIDKYLGETNRTLAQWLLGRVEHEYAIRIVPTAVNSWDFSHRMTR